MTKEKRQTMRMLLAEAFMKGIRDSAKQLDCTIDEVFLILAGEDVKIASASLMGRLPEDYDPTLDSSLDQVNNWKT